MKLSGKLQKWVYLAFVLLFLNSASAQSQQELPPPNTVGLDHLGYMGTFPPVGDKLVNRQNMHKYPQRRWMVQHTRELFPTRNIRRGMAQVSPLMLAPRDLDRIAFHDHQGRKATIAEWQERTYTDALVVLHKGKLIYERYHNRGAAETPHLIYSVTKSFTGLLAAQLIHEGKLDAGAPVFRYVPELSGSAWEDMQVRDVLDMTGAVRYREVYTDPASEVFVYFYASGLAPPPPGYAGPQSVYDFLKTLKKDGEHGAGFRYRTVHSEVLGWIVSRVTGKHFADLVSERIWRKLGMEEDAHVIVDPVGTPLQGAGLCATARDLARFGEMLRRGGEWNGERVFDTAVIDDLRRGGDREKFKAQGSKLFPGYSYHNQWWITHNADGAFEAHGVQGQMIHINPVSEMVVVKLSCHPAQMHPDALQLTQKALAALAQAVKQ